MVRGGRVRRLFSWAGLVALLAAATLALPLPFASWWLGHEEGAWTREDPDAAERLARERPADANATARRLTELARPLGIELQVLRSSDSELAPVIAFVEAERVAEADGDGALPALLERLALHDASLSAIEALLIASEPPAWPHDFRRAYDTTPPPVFGLRALNALLLARAAERARRGDRGGVARALLASSRLDEGVSQRPEALAQIAAAALAIERAGVLRRLADPPPGWSQRLGAHDFRRSFLASYWMEARALTAHARRREEPVGGPEAVRRLFGTQYARLTAADASRRMRGLAAELRSSDPCRVDAGALGGAPAWNAAARATLPYAAQRWSAVRDVELEEELTRVVLDTRAQPPPDPDAVPSHVCPGLVWTRSPDGAGGTLVTAGGVALPPRTRGATWRYRLRRTDVAPPPPAREQGAEKGSGT
jgi:hypothetical protein